MISILVYEHHASMNTRYQVKVIKKIKKNQREKIKKKKEVVNRNVKVRNGTSGGKDF